MARKRDYKAEYRRRVARGLAKGLTRTQARGHPKPGERSLMPRPPVESTVELEAAVRELRAGESLSKAARSTGVSRERFRRFIHDKGLAHRYGRSWVMTDKRPRRVPMISRGKAGVLTVPDFEQASKVGHYSNAVGDFLRSNDPESLAPYRGQGVRSNDGRLIPFETDPNAIHRIANADMPAWHEVYEIVQT